MNDNASPLLKVEGVHTHYGEIHALKGIDLHVNEGEIVALLGANGAGKSTAIKTIMGLLRPSQGSVTFAGESIGGQSAFHVSKHGIALSPEGRRVFADLTIRENLMIGAYARRDKDAIEHDIELWFGKFPKLRERSKQAAGTLSGGEQQMLAIARALMGRPRLLLLDEPSLGMAPLIIDSLKQTIAAVNRQEGTTVLLVEQNADLALQLASRGYVLSVGELVASGSSDELLNSSTVQAAYLGEGNML